MSLTHTNHVAVLSDINECSQHNGGCQVNCINLPGSFACSCNPGSRLLADGRSCERESSLVLCLVGKHCSDCSIFNMSSVQSDDLKNITLPLTVIHKVYKYLLNSKGLQSNLSVHGGSTPFNLESKYFFKYKVLVLHMIITLRTIIVIPIGENDPCASNNGGCQHVCGSGALCSCYPGFRLASNHKSCTFGMNYSRIHSHIHNYYTCVFNL